MFFLSSSTRKISMKKVIQNHKKHLTLDTLHKYMSCYALILETLVFLNVASFSDNKILLFLDENVYLVGFFFKLIGSYTFWLFLVQKT